MKENTNEDTIVYGILAHFKCITLKTLRQDLLVQMYQKIMSFKVLELAYGWPYYFVTGQC